MQYLVVFVYEQFGQDPPSLHGNMYTPLIYYTLGPFA